jgi:hypothetical protein
MTAVVPFLATGRAGRLTRDLSHAALRLHARGRDHHESPMTPTELYDVCGEANELVRNARFCVDFVVVWLAAAPEGAAAFATPFSEADAEEASCIICLNDTAGVTSFVAWLDGALLAHKQTPDAALRAAHELLSARGVETSDFVELTTTHAKAREWGPTRAAAAVATAARAHALGAPVRAALEALAPTDAFVLQHDGLAKYAEAAMADVLRHGASASAAPAEASPRPGAAAARGGAAVADAGSSPDAAVASGPMFNSTLRLFF